MRARIAFVLLAWIAAFLIVTALFLVLGTRLTERPLAIRALIVSGVLVISMTQVVIPGIHRLLRAQSGNPRRPKVSRRSEEYPD